ncbi:hypothetical protein BDN67DRAFT_966530 [Paxillus ammoniavirescens]|nr:hypothetical protein BDN67DRAFT_966530 [Paxillus ammoniavirescens]
MSWWICNKIAKQAWRTRANVCRNPRVSLERKSMSMSQLTVPKQEAISLMSRLLEDTIDGLSRLQCTLTAMSTCAPDRKANGT